MTTYDGGVYLISRTHLHLLIQCFERIDQAMQQLVNSPATSDAKAALRAQVTLNAETVTAALQQINADGTMRAGVPGSTGRLGRAGVGAAWR